MKNKNSSHNLITLSQLEQHDGVKNSQLWILLYGKVYDITEFADKHPGGREMIETACARDSTALFESYHLSSHSISRIFLRDDGNNNNQSMIKYIGEFDEETKQEDVNDSKIKFNFTDYKIAKKQENRTMNIYEILKEQIRNDLFIPALTRQDFNLNIRRVSLLRLLNAIFIFSGLLACQLLSQYLTGLHLSLAIILAFLGGVFHHLSLVHVAHDAGHGSFTDFPTLWRMIGHGCSYLLGQSFYLWTIRHNIAHHVYTNMSEIDPDISIYERGNVNSQERSLPDKKYPKSGEKTSTPIKIMSVTGSIVFLPIMYSLVIVYMQLKDLAHYWRRRVSDGVGFASPTWSFTTFHFYASKIVFVMYRLILPMVLFYSTDGHFGRNALESVLIFSVTEVVAGLLFGFFSQINHISEKCKFSHLKEGALNNRDELDWATIQITTSVDYCHDSYLWTYLSGFLNHQVIHHLFPSINPWLYPKIVPIVKKVCKENNIEYTIYNNFWDAMTAHVRQVTSFVDTKKLLAEIN